MCDGIIDTFSQCLNPCVSSCVLTPTIKTSEEGRKLLFCVQTKTETSKEQQHVIFYHVHESTYLARLFRAGLDII